MTLGLLLLGWSTDGFRALTSEGARRLRVEAKPQEIPSVELVDHLGRAFRWEDYKGRRVLVEFIFTTCPEICRRMTSDFAQLDGQGGRPPQRLSITFDPENDTLERLHTVALSHGADGEAWRFARIEDPTALAETLEAFGIVAIPAPRVGFEHNAAIHGLDREGRLARIADVKDFEAMGQWADTRPGE